MPDKIAPVKDAFRVGSTHKTRGGRKRTITLRGHAKEAWWIPNGFIFVKDSNGNLIEYREGSTLRRVTLDKFKSVLL